MKHFMSKLKNEDGFTLIEMTIVIMVVAALLLLIVPNVEKVTENTNSTTSEAAVSTVESQIILYKMENPDDTLDGNALLEKLVKDKYITQRQLEAYQD